MSMRRSSAIKENGHSRWRGTRLGDADRERQQEAQKLEQRRLNLFEIGKELMKSEKLKDSELRTAKTLYEVQDSCK